MRIDEILERDAKNLVNNRLIGHIEDGSPDGHRIAFQLIKTDLEFYDEEKEKIKFLKSVNLYLDENKSEHQKECTAQKDGKDCFWEQQYDTVIALVKNKIQSIRAKTQPVTFHEKVRMIFSELAQRKDRRGDLESILQFLEIPYIQSDLKEYIDYFKQTGYVDTRSITKDGINIKLRQSGLDFLYVGKRNDVSAITLDEKNNDWDKVVFLAHASEDKRFVRELYSKLKESGLDPWLDEKNLPPGVRWDDEIKHAIKKSRIFLACISRNSVSKSGYIQKELKMALAELEQKPPGHIYFIPVLVEDVELPNISVGTINLRDYQAVNISSREGLERLISHLRDQLNVIEKVERKEKPEFKSIRNYIMHGSLEKALSELVDKFEGSNKSEFNSVILLNSRYNALSKNFNMGLITFEEYSRTLNQITYAILEIIKLDEE